ncbi:type VI secretion system protein TssA [Photobacterium nomapromontoriensis]|uniref:type VI secretion system protein TssA n=1 Tax=Photobacterium nomapromontoriensis TaxID=2910237 RepID=UPI003D0F2271
MNSDVIDFEALKVPIADNNPTGDDPRNDTSPYSAYFSLKDVRNTARAAERHALVDNEPLFNFSHQWHDILEQVPSILTTQCKDLEFTAWFIEALVRNHGFHGLVVGFKTAAILIEHFWDDLYPLPDADGIETRISPLVGLNGVEGEGTLLMPIACIPITELHGEQAYSLWEYEQALEIDRLDADKKKQRIDMGGVDLQELQAAVKASDAGFYHQLLHDIQDAIQSYSDLVELMDRACGYPLPSSQITKRLQATLNAVMYLAEDKLRVVAPIEESTAVSTESTPSESSPRSGINAQLDTRQEAIANLRLIADFFKKTEPHSPMAYAIDQVVRWSDMALPDLLQELISDGDARKGYFRLVGIVPENQQS